MTFDSKVSRSIFTGISILTHRSGPPPRVLVIHLCTNWSQTTFGHEIDRAMAALTGVDRVIWVTCTPWNPGVISADAAIGVASVQYRPRVVVADWAVDQRHPGLHLQRRTPPEDGGRRGHGPPHRAPRGAGSVVAHTTTAGATPSTTRTTTRTP